MGQSTSIQTTLTSDEVRLLTQWQKRVQENRFSDGVAGTRTIKVMGRAGDAPVLVPRLAEGLALDNLSPEERFAVEYGDRVVQGFQARGRSVFSAGLIIERFDATDTNDLIVLSPIAGG